MTEKYGSAIRISGVLTNAKLDVGNLISKSKCGNCDKCQKVCSAHAVSGREWKTGLDSSMEEHAGAALILKHAGGYCY